MSTFPAHPSVVRIKREKMLKICFVLIILNLFTYGQVQEATINQYLPFISNIYSDKNNNKYIQELLYKYLNISLISNISFKNEYEWYVTDRIWNIYSASCVRFMIMPIKYSTNVAYISHYYFSGAGCSGYTLDIYFNKKKIASTGGRWDINMTNITFKNGTSGYMFNDDIVKEFLLITKSNVYLVEDKIPVRGKSGEIQSYYTDFIVRDNKINADVILSEEYCSNKTNDYEIINKGINISAYSLIYNSRRSNYILAEKNVDEDIIRYFYKNRKSKHKYELVNPTWLLLPEYNKNYDVYLDHKCVLSIKTNLPKSIYCAKGGFHNISLWSTGDFCKELYETNLYFAPKELFDIRIGKEK